MEVLIPWERLLEQIRPYYPKAGKGRAPYGLEPILRVRCVQIFYDLSDPVMEDMLYGNTGKPLSGSVLAFQKPCCKRGVRVFCESALKFSRLSL